MAERTSQSSEEVLLTCVPSCLSRWIPTCAQLFVSRKEQWVHFAPKSDYDSSQNIEGYFASVSSFMSLQLRKLVIKSLEDLVSFFMIYKVCRGAGRRSFRGETTTIDSGFHHVKFFIRTHIRSLLVYKNDFYEYTASFPGIITYY